MKDTLKSLSPLLEYFRRNRLGVLIGFLSLLVVDFLQLLIPLVIKKAVDGLTSGTADPRFLLRCAATIVAIAVMMALLRYVWRHFLIGISRKIEEGLRNRLYAHLQTLDLSFYLRTKTGDIMARAINDINAVRMATGMGLVALTDGLILGTSAIGFMVYISPRLTLIALIPAPFLIYATKVITRRMSAGYESVQAVFSDLTERVREAFAGIRVIKAYSREPWASGNVAREGERYISENLALARVMGIFFPLMGLFTTLGLAVVIWLGGRYTILGEITTGDFVAFISYLGLLTWPIMAIGWVANLIQRGSASMRRINRILDERPEITGPPLGPRVPEIHGRIDFRGLSFRYPGQKRDAVKDIRLLIEQGKTVAFVGRVGSGKTTLLHTIPRLLDSPRGTLLVDGMEVQDIPLRTLRENTAFVTQEAMIFSDTVRQNILFGRDGISEEALETALRTVQLFDEIQELEQGVDTLLGERGITLSGGQRQRLCIARAVITEPPILILDDALSMVDTGTEERILNQILGTRTGKTTLIVSHRISTIGRADLIVVLDSGTTVETGNHVSLMARGEEYARLYERQILAQELEGA